MGAPAKFLFDTDFGQRDGRPFGIGSAAQQEAMLKEAEARGYREGLAAAQAEHQADVERRIAAALSRAAAALDAIARGLGEVERRLEIEAVEVAVAVAKKLAPALMQREPLAEIAALVTDCFTHLVGAPHVVVRVNDQLYDAVTAQLQGLASASGFEGRLVVLGDPEIAVGDCRIDWADGGMVRNREASETIIMDAVARYLTDRKNAAPRGAAGSPER